MLLLLAQLAAPPAVAAVNMSTYGALRVSVVREPHHRLPVLARYRAFQVMDIFYENSSFIYLCIIYAYA